MVLVGSAKGKVKLPISLEVGRGLNPESELQPKDLHCGAVRGLAVPKLCLSFSEQSLENVAW